MKNQYSDNWKITKGIPFPPGITVSGDGVNFAIEIPVGHTCELVLYKRGTSDICGIIPLTDEYRIGNVLSLAIEEFRYENYEYKYRIDGEEYLDRYTRSINGKRKFGSLDMECAKNMSCDFFAGEFDWEDDKRPDIPMEDVVLYCLHVRGFTKHASSGVPERHRGTFRGIVDKLSHLSELGINQVELMPVYEFVEKILPQDMKGGRYRKDIEKRWINYWGYSPESYYMAVKKEYASIDDERTELCQMVKELHRNGIEVILEFYFPDKMRIQDIVFFLRYWALEYHIDGFHVTGKSVPVWELARDPVLADRKLYCAYMDDDAAYADRGKKRCAIYAVDYMTAMRSFHKGDMGRVADASYYMRRAGNNIGYINYFTCHDGFTMCDMVSFDHKHNEANGEGNEDGWDYNYSWNCGAEGRTRRTRVLELRLRQMKNAWLMLLLGQGVPAILAGDEWCNSQKGNNNAYCQDNETGWINWKCPKYYETVQEFVKKLIQLRKKHPIFHIGKDIELSDESGVGYPAVSYHSDRAWFMDYGSQICYMGILYCGDYVRMEDGTTDDYFYLLINMDWKSQGFAFPKLPRDRKWYPCISTGEDWSCMENPVEKKQIKVMPRTIQLYIGRKV